MPTDPTKAFIPESQYWQLDSLLERIEFNEFDPAEDPNSQEQAGPAETVTDSPWHFLGMTSIATDRAHGSELEGIFLTSMLKRF